MTSRKLTYFAAALVLGTSHALAQGAGKPIGSTGSGPGSPEMPIDSGSR